MKVEIRNDGSITLDGYINVTSRDSRVLPSVRGKFVEQIEPRTFQKALERTDSVDLLFNHDENKKLGSTSTGELRLYEDNIGLRGIATVTDPEVRQLAESGTLKGWSFGFIAKEARWVEGEGEIARRYVSDMDLLECSILSVTPAYIATSIEQRNGEQVVSEQRFAGVQEVEVVSHLEKEVRKEDSESFDYSDLENYLTIKK